MKAPERLRPLVDEGLIDAVVRQLMRGKEATVYVVRCGDETRCAKVCKEATERMPLREVDDARAEEAARRLRVQAAA